VTDTSYAVVVVSYNHAPTLPACLRAVARLRPAPMHVIVVDNASADGSAEVAAAHAGALPLTLVRNPANLGFAAAANAGIATIATPWVLLLNPDCAPAPDYPARLLAAIAKRPERDAIGCAVGKLLRAEGGELAPGRTIDSAGMVVTPSGRHLDRGAGTTDDGQYNAPAWVFGATAAAALYRRAALDDVAYPDGQHFAESFFAYREDAELAWRLQWRGWRCLFLPAATAGHRRGFRPEAGRQGHDAVNRHSIRNRFLLRLHCADLGWHLACLPWWLARDVLVIGACLTVERGSLPALGDLWRLRADAAARRRWVMGRRQASSRQLRRWFRRRGWTEEVATP
jgi:GT2 family glycosyltransferase